MLEQVERHLNALPLHGGVTRTTHRVPQREISEEEPGNSRVLDDVAPGTDYDGGHASFLELTGNQTHGLVADRSEGDEENNVDVILAGPFDDRRTVGLIGAALAVVGGNTEHPRGQ